MITVPQSTVEKPLTAIDYIVFLEQCHTHEDIQQVSAEVPMKVRQDDRFERAVAKRLAAIKQRKAAA